MKCCLCNKEIRSGEPIVVDPYNGNVYCDPLCAENDFFGGVESPCITLESVMSGYDLKWITKNHPNYHCYETGDFSDFKQELYTQGE